MICKNCKVSNICKINEFARKHSNIATIDISTCEYSDCEFKNNKIENTNTASAYSRANVNERDLNKINELSAMNREKEDSRKKALEKNNNKAKLKTIKAKPLKLDRTCKSCKASTYKEDLSKCSTCGVEICSACATIQGETKELLCEKCWSKL